MDQTPHNLVVIAGPTGSGKSDLALFLAGQLQGEIVSCDSVQVYRYFNIGTAKVPPAERRGIPHHLIDIVEPDTLFTAGEYARLARQTLGSIADRGRLPIVVGGTGFYLRALLEGLSESPPRDDGLRQRLLAREQRRPGSLHRILTRLDPDRGKSIHFRDVKKTMRALELCILRNSTTVDLPPPVPLQGFRVLKVGILPDRNQLCERLNLRLQHMFENGLLDEIQRTLQMGVSPKARPFESLGYKEGLQIVQGSLTFVEGLASAQLATRQYAKRQLTWFRREEDLKWFEGLGDSHGLQLEVLQWLWSAIDPLNCGA